MNRHLVLLALATGIAGCTASPHNPQLGVESVNVPVVTRQDYALDLAAPDGNLTPTAAAQLDGWFRSMQLGYGDSVFVDGTYADGARLDVARIAGNYGILVARGAPVTAGTVAPGAVRVVVSRTQASVPGCPNWREAATPTWQNKQTSNYGCAVNSNLAMMVADPNDLVHGREGNDLGNNVAGNKAIDLYRATPPSGTKGLQDISTKGK
ncbi:CpaD family pilus assembly protein [Sphingomonas sp. ASV193]|uniref:CpaD family pilus assembly protein n=1 Tax=Sphingomonas sp. ASV193 TaxID=3144405 RepID=UPI0032E87C0B